MIRVLMLAGFLAGAALGQEVPKAPAPPPQQEVRKVVEFKYLSGPRAERAGNLIVQFMHPVGSATIDSQLQTAILRGPADVVAGAEALLRKLDTPETTRGGAQVQFTVYLVEASTDAGQGGPVPAAIGSAVEQMKKTFQYGSYRLLDTLLLQARGSGGAEMSGLLPGAETLPRTIYTLRYAQADVLEDARSVALRGFRFNLKLPVQVAQNSVQYTDAGINTDLTVQEGQKLVVGKLSGPSGQSAIFLIITVDVQ